MSVQQITTGPDLTLVARRWSAHAERYHRWGDLAHGRPDYQDAWVRVLADAVGHPVRDGSRPLRVVDVGTGTAEVALLLARMGHQVTGYDIAPGMLAKARTKAAEEGLDVDFVEADAAELPLADASVDVVINRMMLWTQYDPVRSLTDWRRVLVPGGRLVVIDAMHFTPPSDRVGRLRSLRGRVVWAVIDLVERMRRPDPGQRVRGYAEDAVQPPGMSWRDVSDARRHFVDAGMSDARQVWLDGVAEASRRTAPLKWRLAGRLPRFFMFTWDRP